MKIVFSMRHSGALRNFASTVEQLARRGHHVHLAFMMPDKSGDARLLHELAGAHAGITWSGPEGAERGWAWRGLVRAIRATADYFRYLAPEYARASALRDRAMSRVPEAVVTVLRLPGLRSRPGRGLLMRLLRLAESAIPPDPSVLRALVAWNPDVLLVTPLVDLSSDQVEYVKAARALGVPSGLCVHSWDNLTNKGLIHVHPDRVLVWNEAQRREATAMHGIAESRVVVTGAPVYDQWFSRRPASTREEFLARVGLPGDRPYLLYLCSSQFIAPREDEFIDRWIRAVRAAEDPVIREAAILIRPHPRANRRGWKSLDPMRYQNVVIWPPEGANPVDVESKSDYFDSLYYALAAVGINTSAQIEAGIVGRRVYSIRVPEYAATQEGTLHFHYLLSEHGGLLQLAATLDDHTRALARARMSGADDAGRLLRFVEGFVRPHGLDVAATPQLVSAIERLGELELQVPGRLPLWVRLWRKALYPVATSVGPGRPPRRQLRARPVGEQSQKR